MTEFQPPSLAELIELVQNARPSNELTRITAAQVISNSFQELSDRLTDHFVQQARKAGHSWAQIGAQLGMSKQGAHQRYVITNLEGDIDLLEKIMALDLPEPTDTSRIQTRGHSKKLLGHLQLQRFTHPARQAVTESMSQAQTLRHGEIGPEHLLLGLLQTTDEPVKRTLACLGIELNFVRPVILREPGAGSAPGARRPRFGKDAKRTIELAFQQAERLGDAHIGTEHLLLGLVGSPNRAVDLLQKLNVTPDQVRTRLAQP